jgi:hypothetical protein
MGHDSFPCLASPRRTPRAVSSQRTGDTPLLARHGLWRQDLSYYEAFRRLSAKGFGGRSTQSPTGLLHRHPAADWIVAFCFCRADVTYHRRVCPGSSLGFLTPTRPTRPFLADRTWAFSLLTLCRASGCSACGLLCSLEKDRGKTASRSRIEKSSRCFPRN